MSPVWNQPSRMASAVAVVVAAVAGEQVDAAQADLAVVGDAHVDAGQGRTDRADPHLAGAVDGGRGGGLGEAVALEDGDPDAAVEVAEAGAERSAAGDGVLHLAAHRLTQLAVDQLVEDGVAQPQAQRHAAGILRLRPGDGGRGGPVEDLALAAGLGLGLGGVVDLLEDPRHRQDEGRLERREVVEQRLDVGRVPHPHPGRHRQHLDEPGEHVRERQEEQGGGALGLDHLGELLGGVLGQGEEVAVGELDALGSAGRARGVDDRGEAVAVERRTAGVELGVVDVVAVAAQAVDVALVDHPDVLQAGQPRATLLDRGEVGVGLDDHADRAGVGEDPLDLLGRGRLVDRHRHGTGRPQREVGDGPLVPGAAHDRDGVADADAGGDQALGERGDVGGEGGRGDVGPAGARPHGEGDATRLGARPPQRHVGETSLGGLG